MRIACIILAFATVVASTGHAAPYAAMVMDARTGKVLHSRNADTRLHPASLTKMMTLYIAFEAVENGEISLDSKVRISRNAQAEPPSKLGLKSGQRIALRYLIRAAALKSANDAATAIAEAISGSEAAFARRMTRTAKAMGMKRTTFKNAHGLTQRGHMSTARDMTILGRHIIYDYPEYYNLFSRRSTHAGIRKVSNTNRRLLAIYNGSDGIKTGYTRAAGFNLVASARRGSKRIVATMFGGSSSASRNARVAELLDMGFSRAAAHTPLRKPKRPNYNRLVPVAVVVRSSGAVRRSPIPVSRPPSIRGVNTPENLAESLEDALATLASAASTTTLEEIEAVAKSLSASLATNPPHHKVTKPMIRPVPRPTRLNEAANTHTGTSRVALVAVGEGSYNPPEQPEPAETEGSPTTTKQRVVGVRILNDEDKYWSIAIGAYPNRYAAEKARIRAALAEAMLLKDSEHSVVQSAGRGFESRFLGLSQKNAERACRSLVAQHFDCRILRP